MAFMRECWPRRPFRRQSFRLVGETLEQSLQKVPGLLAPNAAPSDVLAGSLHRVIDEEPPLQPSHLFRHHSSPAELASLASGQALHKQPTPEHKAWLVFLFVLLDASKSIAVSHAAVHGRMCAPLVIAWKNALSIGLGLALALGRDGLPGFRNCLAMRRGFQVLPIAAAFGFAQLCAMKALRFYDAGSLKVIAQVNLPLTALLSWLLLDRRYSAQKWLAVGLMLVTNVAFLQVRMLVLQPQSCREELCDDSLFRIAPKVLGMFYFLLGIAVSCSASIFAEKFLKKWPEEPFYILKTNLMIGELILAVLGVINNFSKEDSADEDNDSCSWDQFHDWRRQLPVVLVWLLHGWIAGLLVRRCSALVKNVSHILSTLATYGYALLTHALPFSWPVTQAGVLVLLAVLNFASTSDQRSHKESRRKREKLVEETRPIRRGVSESELKRRGPKDWAKDASAEDVESSGPVQLRSVAAKDVVDATPETQPPSRTVSPSKPVSHHAVNGIWFVVVCFIILDALKPILVTWANQSHAEGEPGFIRGTFVLVQTALSLLVGLCIAVRPSLSLSRPHFRLHPFWRSRVRRCLSMKVVVWQLPVSVCLCLSKLLLVYALGRLDAGTVRVFGQASLPLVGVSSALFFNRRYSLQQWCSLMAVSLGLITFYYVKAKVQSHAQVESAAGWSRRIEVVGILLVLGSICFNCLGALLVERFLKGSGELYEQKAQLLLGEVLVNSIVVFVIPLFIFDQEVYATISPWHRGFFSGWDGRVLLCAVLWIPAGWTATILVKRCSNLLKTVAQASSSVLIYVFSVVPLSRGPSTWAHIVTWLGPPLTPEPVSSPVVLLAISVMLAALSFGADRAERDSRPGWSQSSTRKALPRHSSTLEMKQVEVDWKLDHAYQMQVAPRQRSRQTSIEDGGMETASSADSVLLPAKAS